MTLDDVATAMRQRFTDAAAKGQTSVLLTAEEWNVLAQGIYLRDALQNVRAHPTDATVLADADRVLAPHAR